MKWQLAGKSLIWDETFWGWLYRHNLLEYLPGIYLQRNQKICICIPMQKLLPQLKSFVLKNVCTRSAKCCVCVYIHICVCLHVYVFVRMSPNILKMKSWWQPCVKDIFSKSEKWIWVRMRKAIYPFKLNSILTESDSLPVQAKAIWNSLFDKCLLWRTQFPGYVGFQWIKKILVSRTVIYF